MIILLFFNSVACTTLSENEETSNVSDQTEQAKQPVEQQQEPNEPEAISSNELAWAQVNLDILGYDPGNFDGQFTQKTRTALSKFQMNFDLSITGKLDQSTFLALEQEVQNKRQSNPPPKLEAAYPPQVPGDKPREREKQPPVRVFSDIQTVGVHLVAAYLADAGYFKLPLKKAKLKTVKAALELFQQDIGVEPSGILDDVTWNKLQSIKLSSARQAELEAVAPVAQQQADQPQIEYSNPADKPEKNAPRIIDPAMPYFTLETGETVFVIDKIECKNKNEAFVLFYDGYLQELRENQAYVKVNRRYAMWYDTHHEGVSKDDWWCIPKKRFCYSVINFTDWSGKLSSGDVGAFDQQLTMPSRFDITSLVAHSSKEACSF